MKRILFWHCSLVSQGFLGYLWFRICFTTLLAKIQDGAEGPQWELMLVVFACLGLITGAFFLSYRVFRSAAYMAVPPRT